MTNDAPKALPMPAQRPLNVVELPPHWRRVQARVRTGTVGPRGFLSLMAEGIHEARSTRAMMQATARRITQENRQ